MRRVFISYRRDDSGGQTGHLFDDLKKRFGDSEIFRDLEGLDPGVKFPEALNKALTDCDVVLVMIGPRWSTIAEPRGRRIDQPDDVVRMEIAKALGRKDVCVIPVLVGGAKLPSEQDVPEELRPLLQRNAFDLSDSRWDYDIKRLGDALAKLLGIDPGRRSVRIWATAAGLAILTLIISGFYVRHRIGGTPAAGQSIGLPHGADLSVKWTDQKPPGLSFREWLPTFRDEIGIFAASDGTYKTYVEWPDGDRHFEASVRPAVSEGNNKPNSSKKTSICFNQSKASYQ